MASLTEHIRLKKPDESDYYNVQDQNSNMDKLDAACVISEDVRNIRVMTKDAFDALGAKQSSILYLVNEENRISMYLGEVLIEGGGSIPPFGPLTPHLTGRTGTFGVMERVLIDETKINLLELDENGEQTGEAAYFSDCADAAGFISANTGTNYDMQFGSQVGFYSVPNLTFQNLTNLRHVTLSDKITVLGTGTFQNCSGLIRVDAPQVKSIGQYCFQYCTALESVSMPDVRSIAAQAFIYCETLDNVSIRTLEAPVMSYTFGYCYSLKKIELPTSLQAVLDHAFAECKSLTEMVFSEPLQMIYGNAFTSCSSLKTISLPSTLQSIQDRIFLGCTALETITIAKAEGSISGAPWGAPDAQVIWTGTAAQTNETEEI